MAEKVIMPQAGQDIEVGKVVKWLKNEGDPVRKGEVICEVETEKVVFEVESPADGVLLKIVVPAGQETPIFSTIGIVGNPGESLDGLLSGEEKDEKGIDVSEIRKKLGGEDRQDTGKVKASGRARKLAKELGVDLATVEGTGPNGRIVEDDVIRKAEEARPAAPSPDEGARGREAFRVTPVARKMAEEHDVPLSSVTGTGPGGRIQKTDVIRAMEIRAQQKGAGMGASSTADPGKEALEEIPIQGARRVIFDNMYQSLTRSAQLTIQTEASAEAFIDLRNRLASNEGKISYNTLLIKIAAMALLGHPRINASVVEDAIHVWRQIHIGLAMEVGEVLMVPVVRNPNLKTLREIDEDVSGLVQKAKENRFAPDDMVNGTFTITNLGFADVDHFTPIIRPPESAILGVGRILKKPAVRNNQVVPEARIGLSLTFDHRIIDGAPAARFLKTIKDMVEDPITMIA